MQKEGPTLEVLTRRLAETPEDFLASPKIGSSGRVHVAAVVGDLLELLGTTAVAANALSSFEGPDVQQDRNRLGLTLLLCWLLSDAWFQNAKPAPGDILALLDREATELASQAAASRFVTDPDRREELVRLALARLGYRPASESIAQAQDRLTTLNSAERARVLSAARAAEKRARQIREALMRKAAEESADKYTRE